jgi:hypothetical protein
MEIPVFDVANLAEDVERGLEQWKHPEGGDHLRGGALGGTEAGEDLKESIEVVAVADRDLHEAEDHDGHNANVEAGLAAIEVGNGTGNSVTRFHLKHYTPEDKGAKDESDDSQRVEIVDIVRLPRRWNRPQQSGPPCRTPSCSRW